MASLTENINRAINVLDGVQDAANIPDGIIAEEYPRLVREAIESGRQPPTFGNLRIRYFYRDTVTGEEKIHVQNLNAGENGVFPTDVGDVKQTNNNPALTFQGWNYSQEEINNVQSNIDIGAMYITSDGKTYFHIRVTRTTGADEVDALTQIIYLNKSGAGTLSLSWGDGTATEEITVTGNFNRSHTYTQIGDYWVTCWISSGSENFYFGNATSVSTVFGGSIQSKRNILMRCFVGSNTLNVSSFSFYNCQSLISITLPNNITTVLSPSCFYNCQSLISITLPQSVATIAASSLSSYSLVSISIPNNTTSLGGTSITNCYSLKSIALPNSIITIGSAAFTGNLSLYEYVFRSAVPPTLTSGTTFTNALTIAKIYVPDESVDAYKTATNWVSHALYIFPMSERRM